jgi:hypothetical protein
MQLIAPGSVTVKNSLDQPDNIKVVPGHRYRQKARRQIYPAPAFRRRCARHALTSRHVGLGLGAGQKFRFHRRADDES